MSYNCSVYIVEHCKTRRFATPSPRGGLVFPRGGLVKDKPTAGQRQAHRKGVTKRAQVFPIAVVTYLLGQRDATLVASVRSDATLVRVFAIGDAALSKAAWPADHVTTTIAATHV